MILKFKSQERPAEARSWVLGPAWAERSYDRSGHPVEACSWALGRVWAGRPYDRSGAPRQGAHMTGQGCLGRAPSLLRVALPCVFLA